MLVGDDVFVRGIRRGVEQGEYVYRRGDLLYGPGDPQATIHVDEQSIVSTMAFATERGIWPRPVPKLPEPGPDVGTNGNGTGSGVGSGSSGGMSTGGPPPAPPPPPTDLSAEGVLKEALTQLWEKARARKHARLATVTIRMFEAGDAFRLLGVVGTVAGAQKQVKLTGGYETADGGKLELEFSGPATDASALKEFLEPQLRAAREKDLQATFELRFDGGLALSGDAPEQLSAKLTRYAAGSAYVTASAQAAVDAPAGALA